MKSPLILALEFSTERRSVAVVHRGTILAERVQESGRATRVFSLITDVLAAAVINPADVDTLALAVGPGSYTGIRTAISVAQGWRLATEGLAAGENGRPPWRLIALSSFEVLAAALSGAGWLAADAQKEEWAIASFADGRVTSTEKLVSAAELRALAQHSRVVGPEIFAELGVGETAFPEAGYLGRLAELRSDTVEPESLAPVYLRAASFVKAPPGRVIAGWVPE